MNTCGNRATVRWLEVTALNAMTSERDPHDARFGTTRGSLSTFFLGRTWRYWLAELNNHRPVRSTCWPCPCRSGCDSSTRCRAGDARDQEGALGRLRRLQTYKLAYSPSARSHYTM